MGQSLADKVVLVTGGSRGLGRAMVLAFAEAGAEVVIASRKPAAKAGLANLTRGLAQSLGPAVRVNTIRCGAFATDISKAWPDELRARLPQHNALGRVGEPNEIIGAALFFATDASAFCTGATLAMDGGWR